MSTPLNVWPFCLSAFISNNQEILLQSRTHPLHAKTPATLPLPTWNSHSHCYYYYYYSFQVGSYVLLNMLSLVVHYYSLCRYYMSLLKVSSHSFPLDYVFLENLLRRARAEVLSYARWWTCYCVSLTLIRLLLLVVQLVLAVLEVLAMVGLC